MKNIATIIVIILGLTALAFAETNVVSSSGGTIYYSNSSTTSKSGSTIYYNE